METLINNFLPRIENLGSIIYWLVLLVGIVESLPIISVLIPSSIILIVIGFLATEGTLHVVDLIWAASIGSVLGDSLGYYLGKYKSKTVSKINSKLFPEKYVKNANKYFENHGGKSIFIGRFLGMLRPFLGFVAGMHNMKYSRFLFFNITSGFLWSALYILLGYYFGGHMKGLITWFNISNYVFLGFIIIIPVLLFLWRKLKGKEIINPL